jgi:hypothetical protein
MPSGVHRLEDGWPWGCRIIDTSFSPVVARYKESCVDVVLGERVEDALRVGPWSVVKCEGDGVGCAALVEHLTWKKSMTVQ